MESIINWEKSEVIPVVAQDYETNEVLMLAYMNKEALELTLKTKFAHYFSRSKQRIWQKGETSGHNQKVKEILIDCDNDSIVLKVDQSGVACHTGTKSCFFKNLETKERVLEPEKDTSKIYSVIDTLYHTLLERKDASPDKSYTAKLFSKGENSILKKVSEESGEFCFAVKDNDEKEIIYEGADLIYHILVALAYKDISPDRIKQELKSRFGLSGIDEKASRES